MDCLLTDRSWYKKVSLISHSNLQDMGAFNDWFMWLSTVMQLHDLIRSLRLSTVIQTHYLNRLIISWRHNVILIYRFPFIITRWSLFFSHAHRAVISYCMVITCQKSCRNFQSCHMAEWQWYAYVYNTLA